MQLFSDITTTAIEYALSAESERQRVSAHNVANINTPGFRAQRLEFESNLAKELDRGRVNRATWSVADGDAPENLNGNAVDIEQETEISLKSGLHYDALVQALNFKFELTRAAIGR